MLVWMQYTVTDFLQKGCFKDHDSQRLTHKDSIKSPSKKRIGTHNIAIKCDKSWQSVITITNSWDEHTKVGNKMKKWKMTPTIDHYQMIFHLESKSLRICMHCIQNCNRSNKYHKMSDISLDTDVIASSHIS